MKQNYLTKNNEREELEGEQVDEERTGPSRREKWKEGKKLRLFSPLDVKYLISQFS